MVCRFAKVGLVLTDLQLEEADVAHCDYDDLINQILLRAAVQTEMAYMMSKVVILEGFPVIKSISVLQQERKKIRVAIREAIFSTATSLLWANLVMLGSSLMMRGALNRLPSLFLTPVVSTCSVSSTYWGIS